MINKPHKCSVCGHGFADKCNLKRHEKTHRGRELMPADRLPKYRQRKGNNQTVGNAELMTETYKTSTQVLDDYRRVSQNLSSHYQSAGAHTIRRALSHTKKSRKTAFEFPVIIIF